MRIRAEQGADRDFLIALFGACSPLRDILPPLLLRQQAEAQDASHRAHHPGAMRRIVIAPSGPVGRIVIDWHTQDHSYGVDIAVLPEARRTGAGLHMLRAWLDIADRIGRPCRLDVLCNNPAAQLYARLGFAADPPDDEDAPVIAMVRQAAAIAL